MLNDRTLKNIELKRVKRFIGRWLLLMLVVLIAGYLLPEKVHLPVQGATTADWNKDSFWYYPWGRSITHKGIDIFARKGTPVEAATGGWVVYAGTLKVGGNVVLVLGPKWRYHYYAHLNSIDVDRFDFVSIGEQIGTVGNSGNAAGKPDHLHYTIATPIPYPWRWDSSVQGWRKMFFLNPDEKIRGHL